LFEPQYTMSAVIANEFREAVEQLHLDALVEIGLVLFTITLIVNLSSRLLIWRMTRQPVAPAWTRPSCPPRSLRDVPRHAPPGVVPHHDGVVRRRGARCARACRDDSDVRGDEGHRVDQHPVLHPNAEPVGEPAAAWPTRSSDLVICALGALIAVPIGVMSGIYVAEFKGTRFASIVRFAADTLNGVPFNSDRGLRPCRRSGPWQMTHDEDPDHD